MRVHDLSLPNGDDDGGIGGGTKARVEMGAKKIWLNVCVSVWQSSNNHL